MLAEMGSPSVYRKVAPAFCHVMPGQGVKPQWRCEDVGSVVGGRQGRRMMLSEAQEWQA